MVQDPGPRTPLLDGVKVVEFAHLVAGPLAGSLLADLGADVIHVEQPGVGDPTRRMGPTKDGENLWWKVAGRNKRSVTLDLRRTEASDVVAELLAWADVVITNFRFETLRKWGLDWESVHAINGSLVMLQISGFGTTSSLRNAPGLGKVGEAMSGIVNLTGYEGEQPLHTGYTNGDCVVGVMGAFAISAALTRRHEKDFEGEFIDLALFEPLFRLVEWPVIVHDQLGLVPSRIGNRAVVSPDAVSNTYQAVDGAWITVTSATIRSIQNVARLLGLPPGDFANLDLLGRNSGSLNDGLEKWVSGRTADECIEAMRAHEVVAAQVYTVADIFRDETYLERHDIVEVDDPALGRVRMQGVVPKLLNYSGRVRRTGPTLGEDNEAVYQGLIGISADQFQRLSDTGTI